MLTVLVIFCIQQTPQADYTNRNRMRYRPLPNLKKQSLFYICIFVKIFIKKGASSFTSLGATGGRSVADSGVHVFYLILISKQRQLQESHSGGWQVQAQSHLTHCRTTKPTIQWDPLKRRNSVWCVIVLRGLLQRETGTSCSCLAFDSHTFLPV